jgi:hypothetical protein
MTFRLPELEHPPVDWSGRTEANHAKVKKLEKELRQQPSRMLTLDRSIR